jgi:hypothetical protein
VSDPSEIFYQDFADYEPSVGGPLDRFYPPGIRITGPPTASGTYPNILDLVTPEVTVWDLLNPGVPRVTLAELHPELYTPPNSPLNGHTTPSPHYPDSPILQHIVSRAVTPISTEIVTNHLAPYTLPPLTLLASLTSLASPQTVPPSRSTTPGRLPATPPERQESPSAHTISAPSPPYFVSTPTPSPPPTSLFTNLGSRISSPTTSHLSLPPVLTEEEVNRTNQENRPPTPLAPLPPNPYAPPPCTQENHEEHPHQYYLIRQQRGNVWRVADETNLSSLISFPLDSELAKDPPACTSVIPFKARSHHSGLIFPSASYQSTLFGVPPLTICSNAGLSPPLHDAPHGYIHYTFRPSIKSTLLKHPLYIRLCFTQAEVITDIYDFLDGRLIYTYGKLGFDDTTVYLLDQSHHFEDTARVHPYLLCFTFTPRLPLDPLTFIRTLPAVESL